MNHFGAKPPNRDGEAQSTSHAGIAPTNLHDRTDAVNHGRKYHVQTAEKNPRKVMAVRNRCSILVPVAQDIDREAPTWSTTTARDVHSTIAKSSLNFEEGQVDYTIKQRRPKPTTNMTQHVPSHIVTSSFNYDVTIVDLH